MAEKGIVTLFEFLDLRLAFRTKPHHELLRWIESRGIGFVKDPTDIYRFMSHRLALEPEFAFMPPLQNPESPKVGSGFIISTLSSGSRFYSSPYDRDTAEASRWVAQTSEAMGYLPSFREHDKSGNQF